MQEQPYPLHYMAATDMAMVTLTIRLIILTEVLGIKTRKMKASRFIAELFWFL